MVHLGFGDARVRTPDWRHQTGTAYSVWCSQSCAADRLRECGRIAARPRIAEACGVRVTGVSGSKPRDFVATTTGRVGGSVLVRRRRRCGARLETVARHARLDA